MSQDPVTPQDAAGDASTNANASPADGTQAQTQNGEASNAAPITLEQQLQQTEAKASEHHDAWLRAKAETENSKAANMLFVSVTATAGISAALANLISVLTGTAPSSRECSVCTRKWMNRAWLMGSA